MKKLVFPLLGLTMLLSAPADAKKVKALFIGNSYIQTNNLPEMLRQMALSAGDTLVYSSSTPGGHRFSQHVTNATTLSLIASGGWDVVVLQEQSQLPSFSDGQVASQVYPYAAQLDSLVKVSNPCATTMFYMTWGRKFGDTDNCPYMPVLCTYEGMDSMLQLRYTIMAEDNQASISPVAKVWRQIRTAHPSIELYTADNSHPSVSGTYAAAATFYSMMFQKNPELITFNSSVSASNAALIRTVSKNLVFDSISHYNRFLIVGTSTADFSYELSGTTDVAFINASEGAESYHWDFGDGTTSTEENPTHDYLTSGTYTVTLTITNACGQSYTSTQEIIISTTSTEHYGQQIMGLELYPNPVQGNLTISSQSILSKIQVFNILGTTIEEKNTGYHHSIQLNTEQWVSGIYFIKIYDVNNNFSVRKIMK